MSEIILSQMGYKKGDKQQTLWVLTKTSLFFYKNQQSLEKREQPLSSIIIKQIINNNIKQESPNTYLLMINERSRTTGLYGDFNTMSYWLQAINFVIQDLVESKQELDFLLSSQVEVPLKPKTSNKSGSLEKPQSRRPAPTTLTTAPKENKQQRVPPQNSSSSVSQLTLSSCPTSSLNQKAMREVVALEFVKNTIGREVTIGDCADGEVFAELFEKLTNNSLAIKKNATEVYDKIHNIATVVAAVSKLCKVMIPVDPMDVIRGNDGEIVKFIVSIETFQDGRAFGYIIGKRRPDLLDINMLSNTSPSVNYHMVQKALERVKCKVIPDEVYMDDADESSVIMILTLMLLSLH
ncbi:Calponin-homology (CH) domain-containing protein [Entamoeba marina]